MTEEANLRYPRATFAEPTPYGYIYAGFTVDPPHHAPFVRGSAKRTAKLDELTVLAARLEELPEVVQVTVFEAVLIPPIEGPPRFDIVVLMDTTSPEAIPEVRATETYEQLDANFEMTARNARRIGDTDRDRQGTFLFNHFTAPDSDAAVQAWDDLTGWYTAKADIDNSTVLQPLEDAPYALVNHVRLPHGLARFLRDQLARPSFHRFVRARLRANRMKAMPVFYRLVD